MQIARIEIFQHDLPVRNGPYSFSTAALWSLDTTLVRLTTSDGCVGWGETCPLGATYAEAHAAGARAALIHLAPHLIGASVGQISLLHGLMDRHLAGHAYAKAAFDIAAHDALGHQLQLPVSDLLGGARRDRVPSYYATGIGAPDAMADLAADKLGEGYPRIQMKAGGRAIDEDIAVARAIWDRNAGKARFAVDANRAWTLRDAIQFSQALRDVPLIIEQPCDSLQDLRALRPHLCHPLYMDENATSLATVVEAVGTGLVDGFGMKLTRIGGLAPMAVVRDICAARRIPMTCDDSWGGDIIAAACTAIGSTVAPDLSEGVWLAQPYIDGHYDATGIAVRDGHIDVPAGPGLGLSIDARQFGTPIASFSA